ncbi:MAG: NAD(P)H-dependent oxidoreductase [Neisseriaceae bacterium]|nr:NAD(P)H-dependent oxidoreductase [Neisseriaceae bacterium]
MKTVIVVSHPNQASFSHYWARRHERALAADQANTIDFIDLHQEQFNPVMQDADLTAYHHGAGVADDVLQMQQRLSLASEWVLVCPVYWWSMPAMLKGWVDRVLTRGFAYEDKDQRQQGLLQDKRIRLFMHAAADEATYQAYGYKELLIQQLQQGVFGYCGVGNASIELIYGTESPDFDAEAALLPFYTDGGH